MVFSFKETAYDLLVLVRKFVEGRMSDLYIKVHGEDTQCQNCRMWESQLGRTVALSEEEKKLTNVENSDDGVIATKCFNCDQISLWVENDLGSYEPYNPFSYLPLEENSIEENSIEENSIEGRIPLKEEKFKEVGGVLDALKKDTTIKESA